MTAAESDESDLTQRTLHWAERRPARVLGHNPWALTVRTVRSAVEDRVTGLAAEMAFFGLLSIIPMLVAIGTALGFLERLIGLEPVARAESAALQMVHTVFSRRAAEDVMAPLVEGLFEQQRGGVAVSSVAVSLYLASRVFTAMIRALDLAYRVEERRGVVVQRLLAFGFAVGFVVVLALVLLAVVAGPLLGGGRTVADRLGMGTLFALVWDLVRWPVVFIVAVAFFTLLYHLGPNLATRWRDCLPGAVLGVVLWIAVSLGLRVYLAAMGTPGARFGPEDEALAAVGGVIGAMVAIVLWTFLSGIAILVGGEFNSEISRGRGRESP